MPVQLEIHTIFLPVALASSSGTQPAVVGEVVALVVVLIIATVIIVALIVYLVIKHKKKRISLDLR